MILLYSDHCVYSRALIEEIKRRGAKDKIKMASIEYLRATNARIPQTVHSVPALILPNKTLLFGRAVFEALFGNTGYLVKSQGGASPTAAAPMAQTQTQQKSDEPSTYSFGSRGMMNDSFSFIESEDANTNTSYLWTPLSEDSGDAAIKSAAMNEETKTRKPGLDLEKFMAEREQSLSGIFASRPVV